MAGRGIRQVAIGRVHICYLCQCLFPDFFPLHLKFGMSARLDCISFEGTDNGLFTWMIPPLCHHHMSSDSCKDVRMWCLIFRTYFQNVIFSAELLESCRLSRVI